MVHQQQQKKNCKNFIMKRSIKEYWWQDPFVGEHRVVRLQRLQTHPNEAQHVASPFPKVKLKSTGPLAIHLVICLARGQVIVLLMFHQFCKTLSMHQILQLLFSYSVVPTTCIFRAFDHDLHICILSSAFYILCHFILCSIFFDTFQFANYFFSCI